jgi:hypothetical protein
MSTTSIADFYPCGSYKISLDKDEDIGCKLYKNVSQFGINTMRLDKLYNKGYMDNSGELKGTIEKFINMDNIGNMNLVIILFIVILIYILLRLI